MEKKAIPSINMAGGSVLPSSIPCPSGETGQKKSCLLLFFYGLARGKGSRADTNHGVVCPTCCKLGHGERVMTYRLRLRGADRFTQATARRDRGWSFSRLADGKGRRESGMDGGGRTRRDEHPRAPDFWWCFRPTAPPGPSARSTGQTVEAGGREVPASGLPRWPSAGRAVGVPALREGTHWAR